MAFEKFYNSKCKYSQRIIDIRIGKKSFDSLLNRFLLRYYNWLNIIGKKSEDINDINEYRKNILSRPGFNLYKELTKRIERRFSEDEWRIINSEYQRQKNLKQIIRDKTYKNKYALHNIPRGNREYLELIEVLIMKQMGFNIQTIREEIKKSLPWVVKWYNDNCKNNNQLKPHLDYLDSITTEIVNSIKYEPSGYYSDVNETISKAMSTEQNKEIIDCDIKSCGGGCLEIIKQLEYPPCEKGQGIIIHNQERFCETFKQCTSLLKPQEARILDRYFGCSGHRETYNSIATSINLTRERIRQIKNVALRRMRQYSILKQLRKVYSKGKVGI